MNSIAHRNGIGLLSEGEAALLARLGPEAQRCAADLPRPRRRKGIGAADLVGTCRRV